MTDRTVTFACTDAVARMNKTHWRAMSEDDAAVLRLLQSQPGLTFDGVVSGMRRGGSQSPVYRILQALATGVAMGWAKEEEDVHRERRGERRDRGNFGMGHGRW